MKAAICLLVCLAVSATGYKSAHLPVYHNDHLQFHPKVIVYPAIHKLPATTTTKQPVYAAPPTIDAAYVLENSPFTCHGLIDGHYADISFDCMFFHQCQVFYKDDGQQYIQQAVFPCGEGTLFNQTTKTCDYAENVSCDHLIVESIVRYQQTMPIPTSGPSKAKPIPATSFKCSPHEHKNGYYFADEETDCEVYHRCVYHDEKEVTYATQYSFMCPENLMFNQTTISFAVTGYKSVHLPVYHNDHLQFHPKVIVYPAIHKLPATTTTKRPVYAAPPTIDAAYVLENSPFTCNGLIDGHYADISFDCMFFHQCQVFYKDDGQKYIQQAVFPCGEGTLFNQTTKTCDYADTFSCDHLIVESILRYQQTMPIPTSGPSKAKPIPATSFKREIDRIPNSDVLYIMGDWNAKVGSTRDPGITGSWGLGDRNERGQRLVDFCKENSLIIANTMFKQPKRRLYTWTTPDQNYRNQIDYIICQNRWKSGLVTTKTLPGADCGTDHELLIAKIKIKLKKNDRLQKQEDRFDTEAIPLKYTIAVSNRFTVLETKAMDPEELWKNVKDTILDEASKNIPKRKRTKKSHWLTENTIKIAEERRKVKATVGQTDEYKQLNATFQRQARKDKDTYIQNICIDIEKHSITRNTGTLFKKIKEISGTFPARIGSIKNKNGLILTEAEEVQRRWKEYTEELYLKDTTISDEFEQHFFEDEPQILESEVRWAMKAVTDKKSPGSDNIPIELLKHGGKETTLVVTQLFIVYPAIHKLPATTTTKQPVYAAPPTIDAAYVLENSPFTCHGLIDGHYADISFDCMFFHQCQVFYKDDGQQYIQQAVFPCGEGTLFNQTTKTCDYAENVSCDHLIVESIVRYQQTMPIPTSGPSKAKPIPATSFKCSPHEHKNGYYFADEETDCEVYHRCVYHDEKEITYATQYSFMCPENLMFNQTTISCMGANVMGACEVPRNPRRF
ncbi:Craniofacial development protein 2 [Nymphon striatum]|nr:Craniofacial development protein 2 [Nymphon striatum]